MDGNTDYKNVCSLVKEGLTVQKAVNTLGLNRFKFYNSLSLLQKKELKVLKLLNSNCARYPHVKCSNFKIIEDEFSGS